MLILVTVDTLRTDMLLELFILLDLFAIGLLLCEHMFFQISYLFIAITLIILGLRWMIVDEPWLLDKVANEERLGMSFKELFDKKNIENTLGEVLARNKLSQTRIAETEKYPHVTYFFSGGREEKFIGEKRLMVE